MVGKILWILVVFVAHDVVYGGLISRTANTNDGLPAEELPAEELFSSSQVKDENLFVKENAALLDRPLLYAQSNNGRNMERKRKRRNGGSNDAEVGKSSNGSSVSSETQDCVSISREPLPIRQMGRMRGTKGGIRMRRKGPTYAPSYFCPEEPKGSPITSPSISINPTPALEIQVPADTMDPTTSPTESSVMDTSTSPTTVPTVMSMPTSSPTIAPTISPIITTPIPTSLPTNSPTMNPTIQPTDRPTSSPTSVPITSAPTVSPSTEPPTEMSTSSPITSPTLVPTSRPTEAILDQTIEPTPFLTSVPTEKTCGTRDVPAHYGTSNPFRIDKAFPEPFVSTPMPSKFCTNPFNPPVTTVSAVGARGLKVYSTGFSMNPGWCLTMCFSIGTCRGTLRLAFYDDLNNNVEGGDLLTGLIAITDVLPSNGDKVCTAYDPGITKNVDVYALETAALDAPTESCKMQRSSELSEIYCLT